MMIAEAEAALRRILDGPAGRPDAKSLIDAMIDWYLAERVDDAVDLDHDGDILLFQWGIFGRLGDRTFQYDITRQFISAGADDDDDEGIWQLSVTMHFPVTAETEDLGKGLRWCHRPPDAGAFSDFIEAVEATRFARRSKPERTEIEFGPAG